ncbi:MAG: NFACT family protein, partial [Candidatus Aenigmarchaeota archaeon]|nr:NFACT family protein [Candidatus Aenigmarchaeota archaeon]
MAREDLTSLDLLYLTKELRGRLLGGFFRKIYHYARKQLLFEIYSGETFWLHADDRKLFITQYRMEAGNPTGFSMLLRKHLSGKKIIEIRQHGFDRIIEFHTPENILIIELVRPGNVIFCEKDYRIISSLERQEWKDRTIKRGETYSFPKAMRMPSEIPFEEFGALLRNDRKIVVSLAVSLGLGSEYANEACARAGVDGSGQGNSLGTDAMENLFSKVRLLFSMEMEPRVYGGFASPFPMESMKDRPHERLESFSGALERHFSRAVEGEKQGGRDERILKQQEGALEKWGRQAEAGKRKAELLYENYMFVNEAVQKARNEKSRSPIVVSINGVKIELDIRESLEENAAAYFERAKEARRKVERIRQSIEESKKRASVRQPEVARRVRQKGEWYEKFRWFESSDGFLCIGGRDADSNEALIKKHTDANDLVFHADIQGASFVVIKNDEGKGIPEATIREAAEFAAANSKAWSRGMGTVDVYCVKPDQVSKTPPPGEHLPKGAFMIHGKKEWFRNLELGLSVGVKIDSENNSVKVISGPLS